MIHANRRAQPRAAGRTPNATGSFGPGDAELAHALVDGWEAAAVVHLREAPPAGAAGVDRVHAWAARRRATISSNRFDLTVGHLDLLVLPA